MYICMCVCVYIYTGKPGMLQFMESQRIRHNLVTEQHKNVVLYPHICTYGLISQAQIGNNLVVKHLYLKVGLDAV